MEATAAAEAAAAGASYGLSSGLSRQACRPTSRETTSIWMGAKVVPAAPVERPCLAGGDGGTGAQGVNQLLAKAHVDQSTRTEPSAIRAPKGSIRGSASSTKAVKGSTPEGDARG